MNTPITPRQLTGDILEAFQRGYMAGSDLALWAEELIQQGIESAAIDEALISENIGWENLPSLFLRVCRDVGFGEAAIGDIETLKKNVMIEEYRHGLRQGAELFQRYDDLRKKTGYPEGIHFRLIEDSADGSNASGYYSDINKTHGNELETSVCKALESIGIRKISSVPEKGQ